MEEKMMVTLVKMGDFTFNEESYKAVDKGLFDMLVDMKSENPEEERDELPEMFYFKDKTEYANTAWKYDIDETKPVYVNDKNQIFCFRKK